MSYSPEGLNVDRLTSRETLQSPYTSIAVVGAEGQIGGFMMKELASYPEVVLSGVAHDGAALTTVLASQPELVILATPNPTEQVVSDIEKEAQDVFTIVLLQNGVDVTDVAYHALTPRLEMSIVRMSIFTAVNGTEYNADKRRIAVAPIFDRGGETARVAKLFRQLGFTVAEVEDDLAMEWSKLLLNTFGSTGVVTGLNAEETFADRELCLLEIQALKDRVAVMDAEDIPIINFPWQKPLKLQRTRDLATLLRNLPPQAFLPVRRQIGKAINKERGGQPPAAARKIAAGEPSQETSYYHQPFINAGQLCGMTMPVDRAIVSIVEGYNRGEIDLPGMSSRARRELLLSLTNG